MLVSLAVLVMLIVMVAQLTDSASRTILDSGKHLDADTQARALFDRMASDFVNMPQRTDADTLFYKSQPGDNDKNDKMFFYSQAPAYFADPASTYKSGIAVIGYRISDATGTASNAAPALERLAKGLAWDGAVNGPNPGGMVFTSGTAFPKNTLAETWSEIGSAAPYASGTGSAYHVMADQVFRMEFCFQVKDLRPNAIGATYSNFPVAVTGTTNFGSGVPPVTDPKIGDRWYDTTNQRAYICTSGTGGPMGSGGVEWQPNGLQDVLSVVVTVALLDNTSRKIAPNLSALVSLFDDPDETSALRASQPILPAQIWKTALDNALKNNTTGLPKAVVGQVRIYQRYFYLNLIKTK